LQARTVLGDPDNCYIVLLHGGCGTSGAIYKVTEYWYHSHYGSAAAIQAACGTVSYHWAEKGGGNHAAFAEDVANKRNLFHESNIRRALQHLPIPHLHQACSCPCPCPCHAPAHATRLPML